MKKKKINKLYHSENDFETIRSLMDLRNRCYSNNHESSSLYGKLAMAAADNLGMPYETVNTAIDSLFMAAAEIDEHDIVGEINFVRNCVKK